MIGVITFKITQAIGPITIHHVYILNIETIYLTLR